MARDILCIPASEALVERVFSAARAVCDYRRNQMTPDTIRAIMLVYYQQKIERQRPWELDDIMDTSNMTEAEVETEYAARVDEIQDKVELKFIPDLNPRPPYVLNRTQRNEHRYQERIRRESQYGLRRVPLTSTYSRHQGVSVAAQERAEQVRRRREQHEVLDTITETERVPESEDQNVDFEELRGLPSSQHEGDYPLPPLTKRVRKDLSLNIIDEPSQGVSNITRYGRRVQESQRLREA